VVATGGLSWPKLGVSDLGYRLANKYGHEVIKTTPGLVPLRLGMDEVWNPDLKGISLKVMARIGKTSYLDDLLMTHFGISGPAILQISSHLKAGDELSVNLLPGLDIEAWLSERKSQGAKGDLKTSLREILPSRLAQSIATGWQSQRVAQMKNADLRTLGMLLNDWKPKVLGDMGYGKAEVTLGGVSCKEISSKTMESNRRKGLYFIGEVLDVTGELGGYNFQWAWSSAMACARGIRPSDPL